VIAIPTEIDQWLRTGLLRQVPTLLADFRRNRRVLRANAEMLQRNQLALQCNLASLFALATRNPNKQNRSKGEQRLPATSRLGAFED
jgi:hypothetical protein